jgi:hypothetical protein
MAKSIFAGTVEKKLVKTGKTGKNWQKTGKRGLCYWY